MAQDKQQHPDKENLIDSNFYRIRFLRFTKGALELAATEKSDELTKVSRGKKTRNGVLRIDATQGSVKKQSIAEPLNEIGHKRCNAGDSAASTVVPQLSGTSKRGIPSCKKSKITNCDPKIFYGSSDGKRCRVDALTTGFELSVKKIHKTTVEVRKQIAGEDKSKRLPADNLKAVCPLVISLSPIDTLYTRGESVPNVANEEGISSGLKKCDRTEPRSSKRSRGLLKKTELEDGAVVPLKDSPTLCPMSFPTAIKDDVDLGDGMINGLKARTSCEGTTSGKGKRRLKRAKDIDESDDEEEPDLSFGFENGMYEVERIIAKRKRKGARVNEYFIKWLGWPYRKSTWETAAHFGDMHEVKKEFDVREHALKVVMEHPHKRLWMCNISQLCSLTRWESTINAILRKEGRQLLYVYNDVDGEKAPRDFTYIVRNKYPPALEEFVQKVSRSNACQCGSNCGSGQNCCPAKEETELFYTKNGRIRCSFYSSGKMKEAGVIVECNDGCVCDQSCATRVVQRGRRYKVAIVRRRKCGWGVVALESIPSNTFVVEYVGEVLTVAEAAARNDNTYHFELDGSGEVKYVIDAKHYGNEAAFINHSCDPNLDAVCVHIERIDPSLHHIAFFSNRRINRGEELTLNYFCGRDYEESGSLALTNTNSKGRECFCGAANCMKYWPTSGPDTDDDDVEL